MSILFDILHIAVAALLSVIGMGYEREQDCAPVRFEPSAQVETLDADAASADAATLSYTSACDSARSAIRFPAL
jgi:hypothetical protein